MIPYLRKLTSALVVIDLVAQFFVFSPQTAKAIEVITAVSVNFTDQYNSQLWQLFWHDWRNL